MSKTIMKNLHIPLPEPLYQQLRTEAERTNRPAADLAREAINRWLSEQHRLSHFEAIQEYARQAAGTNDDLDEDLEAAAIEELIAEDNP